MVAKELLRKSKDVRLRKFGGGVGSFKKQLRRNEHISKSDRKTKMKKENSKYSGKERNKESSGKKFNTYKSSYNKLDTKEGERVYIN